MASRGALTYDRLIQAAQEGDEALIATIYDLYEPEDEFPEDEGDH